MRKKVLMIVGCLVIIILALVLYRVTRKSYYDIEKIEQVLKNRYQNLEKLDEYDVSMYFGIDMNDIPSSLFLCQYEIDEINPQVFNPVQLIIVINNEDVNNYYDILNGFIDSYRGYYEDNNLYDNAILKKDTNYIYLILGEQNIEQEKILQSYYFK